MNLIYLCKKDLSLKADPLMELSLKKEEIGLDFYSQKMVPFLNSLKGLCPSKQPDSKRRLFPPRFMISAYNLSQTQQYLLNQIDELGFEIQDYTSFKLERSGAKPAQKYEKKYEITQYKKQKGILVLERGKKTQAKLFPEEHINNMWARNDKVTNRTTLKFLNL